MKGLLVKSLGTISLVSLAFLASSNAFASKKKQDPIEPKITYSVDGKPAEVDSSSETNNHCISALHGVAVGGFLDSESNLELLHRMQTMDPKAVISIEIQARYTSKSANSKSQLQATVVYSLKQSNGASVLAQTPVMNLEPGDVRMGGPDCSAADETALVQAATNVTKAASAAVTINQALIAIQSLQNQKNVSPMAARAVNANAVQSALKALPALK